MIDFWLTTGAMVVNPAFGTGIIGRLTGRAVAGKVFKRLPNAVISDDGVTFTSIRAAGALDIDVVTSFRESLNQTLNSLFPDVQVTVSLYVAGKMCQLVTCDLPILTDALTKTQGAYQRAGGPTGMPSARFTALLGACVIDDGLSFLLSSASGPAIAEEFFVTTAELNLAQTVVADADFKSAQNELSQSGTWDGGCAQRFTFYDKFRMY